MNRALMFVWMMSSVSAWAGSGGYVHEAAGSVSVAVGKSAPRPVVTNDRITSGTVVKTGDESHVVLRFEDGQVISMQSNSILSVRSYVYEPANPANNSIVLSGYKGGMRFISGEIGKRNPKAFRLATPEATISILGTDFMVVMANNTTYSHVASGSISLTNAVSSITLKTGQTGLVPSVASPIAVRPESIPANTFAQLAAIPVPGPVAGPLPAAGRPRIVAALGTPAAVAAPVAVAGGAAAGGAAASTAAVAGGAATGISASTIGIGIGVAALAAAVINQTTTQH